MTLAVEQRKWIAGLIGGISNPQIAKRLSDELTLVHQHALHGEDGAIVIHL